MKNIAQKETRKQPKINTEMNGKGLTVHAGLLPVLPFMGKLLIRERIQGAVRKACPRTNGEARVKRTVSVCRCSASGGNWVDSRSDLDGTGCEGMGG